MVKSGGGVACIVINEGSRMKFSSVIFVCLLCFGKAALTSIVPQKDTYVSLLSADSSFGSSSILNFHAKPAAEFPLIAFDVTGVNPGDTSKRRLRYSNFFLKEKWPFVIRKLKIEG